MFIPFFFLNIELKNGLISSKVVLVLIQKSREEICAVGLSDVISKPDGGW